MKYVLAFVVIVLVIGAYIMFAAEQPVINDITSTANASIDGTLFPETKGFVNWFPLLMWGIPGLAGVIGLVYFLKYWKGNNG